MAKKKPGPTRPKARAGAPQQRADSAFVLRVAVLLVGIVAVVAIILAAADDTGGSQNPLAMTLAPEVIANLTRLPEATPLSGEAAAEWNAFRATVDACGDYRAERRQQMHQHIDWIIDPATIPADIIIALGSNANGKLIFGMATYTSSEWRLGGRNPDSCLVPIGRALNEKLIAAGEAPFDIYDATPAS